jgi:hypothetical protein
MQKADEIRLMALGTDRAGPEKSRAFGRSTTHAEPTAGAAHICSPAKNSKLNAIVQPRRRAGRSRWSSLVATSSGHEQRATRWVRSIVLEALRPTTHSTER